MNNQNNEFTVLKSHNESISSSLRGEMTALLQLCQNNTSHAYFFTYEVLDSNQDIIGSRLFYEFKNPQQALNEWDNFIGEGLTSTAQFTVTQEDFVADRKPSLR